MNDLSHPEHLPAMIDRASRALTSARDAGEVLEARDLAQAAVTAASVASRLARARQAHDDVLRAVCQAKGAALAIEARANGRLSEEHRAARERGEVALPGGGGERSGRERSPAKPTAADLGISRKALHDGRQVVEAEKNDPGIIERTVEAAVAAMDEPTKRELREAIVEAAEKNPSEGAARPENTTNSAFGWSGMCSSRSRTRRRRSSNPGTATLERPPRPVQPLRRGCWPASAWRARSRGRRPPPPLRGAPRSSSLSRGGIHCDAERKPCRGDMRLSHLNGWRALEAVLRLGSVTAAAVDLGVTPAAVGAQIRALEKRLDRPLFQRGPSGLVPADAARGAADRLTRGFSILSDVAQSLSARGGSRQVALTVSQTFAETWLPRHLPTLFARRRGVDIRLETTWEVCGTCAARRCTSSFTSWDRPMPTTARST